MLYQVHCKCQKSNHCQKHQPLRHFKEGKIDDLNQGKVSLKAYSGIILIESEIIIIEEGSP